MKEGITMTRLYENKDDYYRTIEKLNVIMCPKCGVLIGRK
jgi:hypothetical protein